MILKHQCLKNIFKKNILFSGLLSEETNSVLKENVVVVFIALLT